jgi:fucose permease
MESTAEAVPIWTTSTAWLFLAFGFVQVGFESAIGGWITTFANRLSGDDSVRFLSPTLGYFLFFVFGRGVSPLLSLRMRENSMIFVGLSILLCGVAAVVFSTSYGILLLGAIISGFGTSWIFPTNMSRFTRTFGPDSIGRATPLFLAGTLGSAFITYLIGYLSSANKDLRSGMLVLLASAVILIAIQVVLATKTRESRQGSG